MSVGSSVTIFTGVNDEPWCDPSQKGWDAD